MSALLAGSFPKANAKQDHLFSSFAPELPDLTILCVLRCRSCFLLRVVPAPMTGRPRRLIAVAPGLQ